jgi:lipoprotein
MKAMKKLLYALVLLGCSFLYACNDVTVGYLDCANAGYSKDSLEIVRFSNLATEMEGLKTTLDALYSNEELAGLFDQMESLDVELKELEAKMEEMYEQAYALMEEMDIENGAMNPDFDKIAELQAKADEMNNIMENEYLPLQIELEDEIYALMDQIIETCTDMGQDDPFMLEELITERQNQIDKNTPWTTSTIGQILGTEPMRYYLESVRSDRGEEAAKDFASYVQVVGGGRIYVDMQVDSPAGNYWVSLRVENEGHSAVLRDVFKFILKD